MNDIKITQKPIADLIPYSRNPRRNDEAVPIYFLQAHRAKIVVAILEGMMKPFQW